MRYTVTWHPCAVGELATGWLEATDREAVTRAAHEIDEQLAVDPRGKGEDFYGDRILVVPPLAVTYTVNDADRIVQILQVWHG